MSRTRNRSFLYTPEALAFYKAINCKLLTAKDLEDKTRGRRADIIYMDEVWLAEKAAEDAMLSDV